MGRERNGVKEEVRERLNLLEREKEANTVSHKAREIIKERLVSSLTSDL